MTRSTSSLLLALALVALAPVALAGAQHGEEAAHEAPASADAHGGGHGEALTFEGLLHFEHITELYGSIFNFLILFGIFFWVI